MNLECDLELENGGQSYRLLSVAGCERATLDLHVPGGAALLNLLRQVFRLRSLWPTVTRLMPRPLEIRIWLRGRQVTRWSWF